MSGLINSVGSRSGIIGNLTYQQSLNGSTIVRPFENNDMFFMGSYLVSASTTQTVTTPGGFEASNCILMGGRRSTQNAGNTSTQDDNSLNVCNFTGTNTISLYNSSGYTAFIYFCCIRFK